jgi:serine/threonine protein kinase
MEASGRSQNVRSLFDDLSIQSMGEVTKKEVDQGERASGAAQHSLNQPPPRPAPLGAEDHAKLKLLQLDSTLSKSDVDEVFDLVDRKAQVDDFTRSKRSEYPAQRGPRSVTVKDQNVFYVHDLVAKIKPGEQKSGSSKQLTFCYRIDRSTGQVNKFAALKIGSKQAYAIENQTEVDYAINEAKVGNSLKSDYIMPTEHYVEYFSSHPRAQYSDRAYLFQELASGDGVDFMERKDLSKEDVLWLGRETAKGIGEMHDKGLIHRDVKEANVLVFEDEDGKRQLKVADFGFVHDTKMSPFPDDLAYTLGYAPKEVVQEKRGAVANDDIYALGQILKSGYSDVGNRGPTRVIKRSNRRMNRLIKEMTQSAAYLRPSAKEVEARLNEIEQLRKQGK